MHILLTRPYFQSLATQKELETSGHTVSFSPVLNIQPCAYDTTAFNNSAAFVVTSANGALHLGMGNEINLSLPIYAVGPATAAPLINAGFSNIHIAEGDAESLIPIILEKQAPSQGIVTYLSGENVTEDIADTLKKHGYQTKRVIAYKAKPIPRLSQTTQKLFQQAKVDVVIFMSYRTALHFTRLIEDGGLSSHLCNIQAVCMSQQVATGLHSAHWQDIHISDKPSLPAIYSIISRLTGNSGFADKKQAQPYQTHLLNEFNLGSQITRLLKENTRAAQSVMEKIRPLLDTYEAEVSSELFQTQSDQTAPQEDHLNDAVVLLLYNTMKVKFRVFSVNLIKQHTNSTHPYWHVHPNLDPCCPTYEKNKEKLGKEWIAVYEAETNSTFQKEFQRSNLYQMLDPETARSLFSTAYQKFYDDTVNYYSRIDRHP